MTSMEKKVSEMAVACRQVLVIYSTFLEVEWAEEASNALVQRKESLYCILSRQPWKICTMAKLQK